MKYKKCIKCQRFKKITEFPKRDGTDYRNECKQCFNAYQRQRYAELKGGRLEARRASREADPKICIKCGQVKPLNQFGWHNRQKGQHRNMCRDCQNAWARHYNKRPDSKKIRKDWEEKNRERIEAYKELYRNDPEKQQANRIYHRKYLLQQFGMTVEQYDEFYYAQKGRCAICRADRANKRVKSLIVDHDHATGKIRGLLCTRCNQAIGAFQDNPDLLRKAAQYLEQ